VAAHGRRQVERRGGAERELQLQLHAGLLCSSRSRCAAAAWSRHGCGEQSGGGNRQTGSDGDTVGSRP
jgi:hypothetical protein